MRAFVLICCLLAPALPARAQDTADAAARSAARAAMQKKIEEGDALLEKGDTEGALKCYEEAVALFRQKRPAKTPRAEPSTGDAVLDGCVRGLDWLIAQQDPDGGWTAERFGGRAVYTEGIGGLAVLALLQAPASAPNRAACLESAKRGLQHFMDVQDPDGYFGRRDDRLYGHVVATQALCVAYRRTKNPVYGKAAQWGIDLVEKAQNPGAGWRYTFRPGSNDTSSTDWCVLALAAGRDAGLKVDPAAFRGALSWVEQMTSSQTGRTGYQQCGGDSARPDANHFPPERSAAMTAAGIVIRLAGGQEPDRTPAIRLGTELMVGLLPRWDDGWVDMDYWYQGTLAAHRIGGPFWRHWSDALKTLLPQQQKDGSWTPAGPWGGDGGRVFSTAVMTMCLEKCIDEPANAR